MTVDMSKHFSWRELLRFVAPSIASMLFSSIYGIVDGFFVSNYAGKTAFAGVNLIMPLIMVIGAVGFMVGTGGAAIVGKTRGEGRDQVANEQFSMFVAATFVMGVVLSCATFPFLRTFCLALGAQGSLLDDAVLYGALSLISMPFFMLQYLFQTFFVTAGKPRLGFAVTLLAGLLNITGDILLVGVLHMGVLGAALATNISEIVGGSVPVIYFARQNTSALRLVRPHLQGRLLGAACINGSSEMMTNLAVSIVSTLYNLQLMRFSGEDGVAAYGIVMYVSMVFAALFNGYNIGSSPLMSYKYGAQDKPEMASLFLKGLRVSIVGGVAMFVLAQLCAYPIASLFGGYDEMLRNLTVRAMHFVAFSFGLMGFSMFGSALFTSLGNGKVSALISFLRTIVFECSFVMLIPLLWGLDGVWVSWPLSEVAATGVTVFFMISLGREYGYLAPKTPKT